MSQWSIVWRHSAGDEEGEEEEGERARQTRWRRVACTSRAEQNTAEQSSVDAGSWQLATSNLTSRLSTQQSTHAILRGTFATSRRRGNIAEPAVCSLPSAVCRLLRSLQFARTLLVLYSQATTLPLIRQTALVSRVLGWSCRLAPGSGLLSSVITSW